MWLTWTISTDSVLRVPHPECHPECQQRNINVYHFNTEQVGSEATFMDAILFRNLILLMLQLAFEHQILTLIVSLSWSLNYWTGNQPLISCISLRELQCISYKESKDMFDDTIISSWMITIKCTLNTLHKVRCHNQLEIFDIWTFFRQGREIFEFLLQDFIYCSCSTNNQFPHCERWVWWRGGEFNKQTKYAWFMHFQLGLEISGH